MPQPNLKFVALPVPEIIGGTQKWADPEFAHAPFSPNFSWAFVWTDPVNVAATFEVRSFTHSWDNREYSKNLGSPWLRPRSIFSQIFNGLLFGWTLRIYRSNLQSVALAVPQIIAIAVLGWGCEPPILGRGGRRRSGMVPFERAFVTSYRLSIVTFLLSQRYGRFCAPAHHFFPPHL